MLGINNIQTNKKIVPALKEPLYCYFISPKFILSFNLIFSIDFIQSKYLLIAIS